jgi:hypothetical protein
MGLENYEKEKIVRGLVKHKHQWMSMDEKMSRVKEWEENVQSGLVEHQGRWLSIQEKIAVLDSEAPKPPPEKPQIIDQRTFNIHYDQRTTNEEHRHLHMDEETLKKAVGNLPPGEQADKLEGGADDLKLKKSDEIQQIEKPKQKLLGSDNQDNNKDENE